MIEPHYQRKRRVEFVDTDMAGIVHFSNFFRYMEETEAEFFRSLDLHLVRHNGDGTAHGWPRVSTSCSFKAPAYFEDVLDIKLWVVRKGFKSLTMKTQFWRGETHIATGQVKTAYCIFAPHQPIQSLEIPAVFSERFVEADPDGIA